MHSLLTKVWTRRWGVLPEDGGAHGSSVAPA
jgi:hypothetical protein